MSMSSVNNNAVNNFVEINLDGMDVGTAYQAVLGQRAELLEDRLRDGISGGYESNKKISELNKLGAQKTHENNQLESDNIALKQQIEAMKAQQAGDTTNLDDLKALRSDLKATADKVGDEEWMGLSNGLGDDAAKSHELYASVKDAGLTIPTGDNAPKDTDKNGTMDAKGTTIKGWVSELDAKIAAKSSLAELEAKLASNESTIITNKSVITDCKDEADNLSATQQLDMIAVTGINNKRDQTFSALTASVSNESKSKENILQHS